MQEQEIFKKLNELKENGKWEILININNECAYYNGSTDEIHYNDEEFFEIFFPNNAMEAVRSAYYGDYRYTDEYVMLNGYNNLESFNLSGVDYYLDLDNIAFQIAEEESIYENVEMWL